MTEEEKKKLEEEKKKLEEEKKKLEEEKKKAEEEAKKKEEEGKLFEGYSKEELAKYALKLRKESEKKRKEKEDAIAALAKIKEAQEAARKKEAERKGKFKELYETSSAELKEIKEKYEKDNKFISEILEKKMESFKDEEKEFISKITDRAAKLKGIEIILATKDEGKRIDPNSPARKGAASDEEKLEILRKAAEKGGEREITAYMVELDKQQEQQLYLKKDK